MLEVALNKKEKKKIALYRRCYCYMVSWRSLVEIHHPFADVNTNIQTRTVNIAFMKFVNNPYVAVTKDKDQRYSLHLCCEVLAQLYFTFGSLSLK